jgi:hypothetical protein
MDAKASDALSRAYLADTLRSFRMYKKLGDAAMAQVVADADLLRQIDPGSNSIATVVKHLGGNLRSRFRDFLTTDGEKPDRDRDGEFEMALDEAAPSRAEILEWWESGFAVALASIESLEPDDLMRTVYIRREPFLVVEALNRLVTQAYHVGQIVYVARHVAGDRWTTLSIPKGQSKQYGVGSFKDGVVPRRMA